ncbi:MAG: hypothetical protein ACREH8_10390 [Opitutaceae bacterium]
MPAENRHNAFADAMTRISFLPANERVDALLKHFVGVLDAMDADNIRTLRDQIMERFSTCGCRFDTCVMMIELINHHLAFRDMEPARRVTTGS